MPTDHQSSPQPMSFPDGPLNTQSHSVPSPSQTKHPAHCCNSPGIDTACRSVMGQGQEQTTNKTNAQQIKLRPQKLWGEKGSESLIETVTQRNPWQRLPPDLTSQVTNLRSNSKWGFGLCYLVMNLAQVSGRKVPNVSITQTSDWHFKPKQVIIRICN